MFRSHLELAHSYWEKLLKPGDVAIDATCGNGHDTLFLATLVGRVIAIDIQEEALKKTKERIPAAHIDRIQLIKGCHSNLPQVHPKLVVYNLGYLPGGDKSLTTRHETTLQSLSEAAKIVLPHGAISIMCYPGHPEGKIEEEKILQWASSLNRLEWACCHHRWVNRQDAPSLLLVQKHLE